MAFVPVSSAHSRAPRDDGPFRVHLRGGRTHGEVRSVAGCLYAPGGGCPATSFGFPDSSRSRSARGTFCPSWVAISIRAKGSFTLHLCACAIARVGSGCHLPRHLVPLPL